MKDEGERRKAEKRKSGPSADSASSPPRSEQRRGARAQDRLGNRESGEWRTKEGSLTGVGTEIPCSSFDLKPLNR